MKQVIANQTWSNFVWPEWVLQDIKKEIEDFWSDSCGRGPADWHENAIRSKAPLFGARVRMYDFQNKPVDGLFVFAWNNIGRLIGDDGQVKYVGVNPFLISRGGMWQQPEKNDYANLNELLPFYARDNSSLPSITSQRQVSDGESKE